ncbi:unnamed protein product, partial [Urochloa humidicola]
HFAIDVATALSHQTLAATAALSHQTLAAAAALSVIGEEPQWWYSPATSLSLSSSTSQAQHTRARLTDPTHGRHTQVRRDKNLWRRGSPVSWPTRAALAWWGPALWAAWSAPDLVDGQPALSTPPKAGSFTHDLDSAGGCRGLRGGAQSHGAASSSTMLVLLQLPHRVEDWMQGASSSTTAQALPFSMFAKAALCLSAIL